MPYVIKIETVDGRTDYESAGVRKSEAVAVANAYRGLPSVVAARVYPVWPDGLVDASHRPLYAVQNW